MAVAVAGCRDPALGRPQMDAAENGLHLPTAPAVLAMAIPLKPSVMAWLDVAQKPLPPSRCVSVGLATMWALDILSHCSMAGQQKHWMACHDTCGRCCSVCTIARSLCANFTVQMVMKQVLSFFLLLGSCPLGLLLVLLVCY